MTAFDATAVKRLGAMRVQAILHKPFDIERVVEMIRDCALLHAEHVVAAAAACKHAVSEESQTAPS